MTKKVLSRKGGIIISAFFTVLFVVYTLLVKCLDVKAIGPNNSEVGFSSLNDAFRNLVGNNMTIYKISEIFGYVILLLVVLFGVIGLMQLIKRKSIKKVDREIIILGCFYVLVGVVYVLFEKIEINYRPVLMDGVLEASYPSSHTILSLCVGISALIISKKYIPKKFVKIFNICVIALIAIVLLGRIISGVHWISDIIGGLLVSITLLMYFKTALEWNRSKK